MTTQNSAPSTDYYSKINIRFLWLLWAHVPICALTAYLCGQSLTLGLIVGAAIAAGPTLFVWIKSESLMASTANAVALVSYSALLIFLSGGKTELHFHIFASLGLLITLAQPRAVAAALGFVVVHHVGLFFLMPRGLINYDAGFGILVIHAVFALSIGVPAIFISNTFRRYIVGVKGIVDEIRGLSDGLSNAAETIQVSSKDLLAGSETESSALQNTSASLDELNAMILRNSENAASAAKAVETSKHNSENALDVMNSVMSALGHIQDNNLNVVKTVTDGNQKIEHVAALILEIGTKTKIINDIVFQTKLLSFNASVEAARAGEHGKGFSVVAEEIGNLAKMSGSSAKEIGDLIDKSVMSAREIVDSTKLNISKIVNDGKHKIDEGFKVAATCKDLLSSIDEELSRVTVAASEIASASKKQSVGVSEITKAMHVVSGASQRNVSISNQTLEVANSLSANSNQLRGAVSKLMKEVGGEDAGAPAHADFDHDVARAEPPSFKIAS